MPAADEQHASPAIQAEHDAWTAVVQLLLERGIDLEADGELATAIGLWGGSVLAIALERMNAAALDAPRSSRPL